MPTPVDPSGVAKTAVSAGKLPIWLLVHTAVPLVYADGTAKRVEGEPGDAAAEPEQESAFQCVLFLPSPGGEQQSAYRPRVVREPTMLCNPSRADRSAIVLGYEDELFITAPELEAFTGAVTARWQIVGMPQPFGRPGKVFGIMATLRQVLD